MAVSVVGLEQSLAPAAEAMLDGNHHSMVVGNGFGIEFCYGAESRIGRTVRDWIVTPTSRKGTKAPRVCVKVLNEFVDSVMAKVTDAQRSSQFQTPAAIADSIAGTVAS